MIRDVSPGDPLQPGGSAPLFPLRFSGALIGEGAAGWTRAGEEHAGAGGFGPRGGKLGGGRRRGLRPGQGCRARGRSLTCWSPGPAPGWAAAARRGLGSARGSGHWAQAQWPRGSDPRILRAPPPSRLRGSVRAPGLGRRRAGSGWGRGRGRGRGGPRLGSAWGLGPRAGSAPERRARGSARGAPPARRWGTHRLPPGRTHSHTDPGRTATDSRPRGCGQTDTGGGTHTPTRGRFATDGHPRGRGQAHMNKH